MQKVTRIRIKFNRVLQRSRTSASRKKNMRAVEWARWIERSIAETSKAAIHLSETTAHKPREWESWIAGKVLQLNGTLGSSRKSSRDGKSAQKKATFSPHLDTFDKVLFIVRSLFGGKMEIFEARPPCKTPMQRNATLGWVNKISRMRVSMFMCVFVRAYVRSIVASESSIKFALLVTS